LKTCSRCHEQKPRADFYRDKRASDGLNSHCKSCHVVATQAYKAADPQRRKAQDDAWRAAHVQRVRAARDTYDERNPDYRRAVIRDWRTRHPDRARAHNILNRAVRSGRLQPASECATCGISGVTIEGHHPDYSKALEVEWLCRRCHAKMGKH